MEKKDWFDNCYYYSWEEVMCCEDEHIWRIRMGDGTYIELQIGGYGDDNTYLGDTKEESYFNMSLFHPDRWHDYENRIREFILKGTFDNGLLEAVPYKDCIKIIEEMKQY